MSPPNRSRLVPRAVQAARPAGLIACNWSLLVLILIGLPTAAGVNVGGLRIAAREAIEDVTLAALILGWLINVWLAFRRGRNPKVRKVAREWIIVYTALGGLHWLVITGRLDFEWLKNGLLWLRDRMP